MTNPRSRNGMLLFLLCLLPRLLAAQNIVLVTLDTTRADHLSLYGYAKPTSPQLEALGARARVFDRAYSVVPLTLPAHLSMLTGQSPFEHGIFLNGQRWKAGEAYLPLLAKKKGYATAAVVSSVVLDRATGLNAGFDIYDDAMATDPGQNWDVGERLCADTTARAVELVKTLKPPFLLWVHYYDPHTPYRPPKALEEKFASPYDGELAAMDACLGTLAKALPEGTRVVIAGDHGEMLEEHGEAEHGVLLYEGAVHVPLLVAGPGIRPARVKAPVSILDIHPTVVSWLEGSPSDRSLASDAFAPPKAVVASSLGGREVYGYLPSMAVLSGDFKLLWYGEADHRLFDLPADPGETRNLFIQRKSLAGELKRKAQGCVFPPSTALEVPQETLKALASLGYLAPSKQTTLIHPEEGLAQDRKVRLAKERAGVNDFDRAAALLKEVLAVNGHHSDALSLLGRVYRDQGRPGEAAQILGVLAALRPEDAPVHLQFGQVLAAAGRNTEALTQLRKAVDLNPRLSNAYGEIATLYSAQRDTAGLEALWQQAQAQGVEAAPLLIAVGSMEKERGRYEAAFTLFHRARVLEPLSVRALKGLVSTCLLQGRDPQALAYARQLIRLDPAGFDGYYTAGLTLLKMGENRQEAVTHLHRARAACPNAQICAEITQILASLESR